MRHVGTLLAFVQRVLNTQSTAALEFVFVQTHSYAVVRSVVMLRSEILVVNRTAIHIREVYNLVVEHSYPQVLGQGMLEKPFTGN